MAYYDRDQPLATGIGVLKTMLGAYVLFIVGICIAAAKQAGTVEEDPAAIESEYQEPYTVIECNGKTFVIDTASYDNFMNSPATTTVFVDTMSEEQTQTVVSKDELHEIQRCDSYEEAAEYIANLDVTMPRLK